MCDFEIPMGTGSLGVDSSFGDALSIEVGQFVDEVEVGDHDRAPFSSSKAVLVVIDWLSSRGGHHMGHFMD